MLIVGAPAPAFTLPADDGSVVALKAFRGRTVILYFYPRDDTEGCTTQACEFRDRWRAVQRAGAVVLGISPDGVASHRRFRASYRLPFPLLADENHAVAERYGVWGEKVLFGRRYHGILRTTFLIGGNGRIQWIFERVRPKGHAAEVLVVLRDIESRRARSP